MSDNVLENLRQKRARASVPIREDALLHKPNITSQSLLLPEDNQSLNSNAIASIQSLQEELTNAPETVRHSAIVLERTISQDITTFCKNNKITVELFLESAWLISQTQPDILQQILVDAKKRYLLRKRVGNTRRLLTTLEKLKS